MASLQQIVRNLNAKSTSMSLNERFAMLSSARQQQQSPPQPPQSMMYGGQAQRAGWMSPPQMMSPGGGPVHFASPGGSGGMAFANRMAQARMRSANGGGSAIGVISGVRGGGGGSQRRGGSANNFGGQMRMTSPKQQMRSPQMIQQQRMAQAFLRKATEQNRRLAQQMLARPAAVRIAQKLKKRSVLQRLGTKGGQPGIAARRPLGGGLAKLGLGQRRSLGGLGSPRRGRGPLAGRLGAKAVPLNQRLGPKKNSPLKQQRQAQQPFQQRKQLNQPLQQQQLGQQRQRGTFNRRGARTFRRGGSANNANNNNKSPNPNLRYFSAPAQGQQQNRQNFNRRGGRRGGRGANNNQQFRGQASKATLDADMDSYWSTNN